MKLADQKAPNNQMVSNGQMVSSGQKSRSVQRVGNDQKARKGSRKRISHNAGLFIAGLLTVFSGLLIQVEYHMGNRGDIAVNDLVFGLDYNGWSDIHKISIVALSVLMIFHFTRHWKWYRVVIRKRLFAKNRQVLTLSVVFVLVALTGFIPWLADLMTGDEMLRKTFIEIHDKLAILLSVYMVLHVGKRLSAKNWF
jgi:hypothetical protein